jgi:hypothetical protein
MKNIGLMIVAVVLMAAAAMAQETKYATSSTGADPNMTFAPKFQPQVVKSLQTSCDVALGAVKFYTRTGKYAVTGTNSATVVKIANTTQAVTNGDIVVYVHANGTINKDTIASCTTTNVTLSTGISIAWSSGDYLYEVEQSGQIVVADNSAAAGTNKLADFSGDVFVIPADSPLYAVMDGATNTCLSITVE